MKCKKYLPCHCCIAIWPLIHYRSSLFLCNNNHWLVYWVVPSPHWASCSQSSYWKHIITKPNHDYNDFLDIYIAMYVSYVSIHDQKLVGEGVWTISLKMIIITHSLSLPNILTCNIYGLVMYSNNTGKYTCVTDCELAIELASCNINIAKQMVWSGCCRLICNHYFN